MPQHSRQSAYNLLARQLASIAVDAGLAIMPIYNQASCSSHAKMDGSPVTVADHAAEDVVIKGLKKHFPGIQIVAEETSYKSLTLSGTPSGESRFFLVDALDGTREFIEKRPEFTVNIALIENGNPVAGAVYSPASRELYYGGSSAFSGIVSFKRPILPKFRRIEARVRPIPIVAAISRHHMDDQTTRFLEGYKIVDITSVGSSIKFCRIAEGLADIYPRFGPTMEWDTAAGHAIVNAAGGTVLTPDGTKLTYGKQGYKNGSFVAWGK